MKLSGTPTQDGFRLPAEFEGQSASYMIWPQRPGNWRDGGKPAQRAFTQIAELLAQVEPVTMLVNQDQYANAKSMLSDKVRLVEMSSNDAWMKDYGPFYVINQQGDLRAVDFQFNAWGGLTDGLYFPWDLDNQIAVKVADLNRMDYYTVAQTVLEGCAILVDGQGTLFATEDVVLSEGRNANGGLTKAEAEQYFHDYFGVTKTIWLPQGYFMDETGGDIDNLINVVAPGEVVLTWTDDPNDPQQAISEEAYQVLRTATDAQGRHLKIHKLPIPQVLRLKREEANGVDRINGDQPRFSGQRLTASYVNYITANHALLVPEFNDPNDLPAQRLLAKLYPGFRIIGVPSEAVHEVLTGGGGIHTIVDGVPSRQKSGDAS
ncbi:agmatine deiminase [Levilactobacillus namurensis]|uniref:Putative agmatine deiminase n=1 Tax=Levilactobacillus namurensis TaxID=380393 RepID=A0AAW8W4V6_9LACO|nr:agmatine deiminase [Levilactobacillus namurensis]MDT7013451.1 agmatine deiminase [Levilactobacillus namurensis]